MIDAIIFLTDRYPFGTGENFIHNEIPYMKKNCKKLFIIPVNARDYSSMRLMEDDKTYIWKGNRKSSIIYKVMNSPVQFFDTNIRNDIQVLYEKKKLSYNTLEFLLYFSIEYKRLARFVKRWLKGKIGTNERILIYSYWLYNTAYVGCLLKKNFPTSKLITRGHRFDIYLERNQNNYLPLRQFIISNMDYIFPISDNGTKYLKNFYPYQKNIMTQRLGTVDYGIGAIRKEKADYIIVSCSNIIPVKRCFRIVDILSHIHNISIHWYHFGDGNDRKNLKEYAKNNLSRNVQIHIDGALNNADLTKFYLNNYVDLFINVSESEGIPVSIMEALSFGIPVVATDVGGISEIVSNDFNGALLSKDFDDVQVAKKIYLMLCGNSEIMRENARKEWMIKYSADKNYKNFYRMLEQYVLKSEI